MVLAVLGLYTVQIAMVLIADVLLFAQQEDISGLLGQNLVWVFRVLVVVVVFAGQPVFHMGVTLGHVRVFI